MGLLRGRNGDDVNRSKPSWAQRPRRDAADFTIKLSAAVVLIGAALGVAVWFTDEQAAETNSVADRIGREAGEAALWRQSAARSEASRRFEAVPQTPQPYYSCSGSEGVVIQRWPCGSWPTVETGSAEERRVANVEWQERNRRVAEARLRDAQAALAAATGTGGFQSSWNPPQANPSEGARARCQAQKDSRETILNQAGLHRTFELIRSLNDQVYEACKGT